MLVLPKIFFGRIGEFIDQAEGACVPEAEAFSAQVEGTDLLVFPVHVHDDNEAVGLFKVLL